MHGAFFMQILRTANQTVLFLLHKRGEVMTTIELFTDDQKLYYAKKVYIASGDIKSVQLQVDFCGGWDNYPVRTATFTNDDSKVSVDKVMTRNKCTIPFEVLTTSGTLYISIVGDAADGSKRKTSGRIKYRVDVGAELSDITLTPTKDVYQQFLAAIYELEDPITQGMKASVEATIAEELEKLRSEVDEMQATVNGVVLWENDDTSVEFAAQPVEVNLTEYHRFTILFKVYGSTYAEYHFTEKDISHNYSVTEGIRNYNRGFTAHNGGIEFSSGEYGRDAQEVTNNAYMIPCKIKGYK